MRLIKLAILAAGLTAGLAATLPAQAADPVIGPPFVGEVRYSWFALEGSLEPDGSTGQLSRDPLQQARKLVARGRYVEADAKLSQVMDTTNTNGRLLQVRFLKGVSALGQGDPATARSLLKRAADTGRSEHVGALSALAVAEVQLGDRAAAEQIRGRLQAHRDACESTCRQADAIASALSVVDRALVQPS